MLQDAYSNLSIIADKLVSVCDKFGVHVRLVDDSVFFFVIINYFRSWTLYCRHLWKLCERISLQIYNGRITSVDDFMLEVKICCNSYLCCMCLLLKLMF